MKKHLCFAFACALLLASVNSLCLAQRLRQEADKAGFLVGAAVDPLHLSEPLYAETLAREFNMIEPENAMKWGAVRPDSRTFNFAPGDKIVAFAKAHGMKVRGHTLLWSEYNPAWLVQGNFTPAQLRQMLREHISRVMKHYRGQVFAWDVVNESFEADGKIETSIWYDKPGIGYEREGTKYIEQAFRWARAADPKALLFYNDYDSEGLNPKSDAIYRMVKDFRRRGVPIDGVGLQMHLFNLNMDDISSLAANIERLTALGLQVHITEMDVSLPIDARGDLLNQADLSKQAEIYRFVIKTCLEQKGCTAFQTWGFTDKYTWIPNYTKGAKGAPLLFDRNYAAKPAYRAILEAFNTQRRATE